MRDHEPIDQWTPDLVKHRMIEAIRWAQYSVGPVGPSGIRSTMPSYAPTLEERLEEGWGLPDGPDEEEERARAKMLRVMLPPDKVSETIRVLEWPARFLVPNHAGDARVLGLWLRCKVLRLSFDEAVKRRRYLDRGLAYRMRDRALRIISLGLDKAGEKP